MSAPASRRAKARSVMALVREGWMRERAVEIIVSP
jgi:hypothetical protein